MRLVYSLRLQTLKPLLVQTEMSPSLSSPVCPSDIGLGVSVLSKYAAETPSHILIMCKGSLLPLPPSSRSTLLAKVLAAFPLRRCSRHFPGKSSNIFHHFSVRCSLLNFSAQKSGEPFGTCLHQILDNTQDLAPVECVSHEMWIRNINDTRDDIESLSGTSSLESSTAKKRRTCNLLSSRFFIDSDKSEGARRGMHDNARNASNLSTLTCFTDSERGASFARHLLRIPDPQKHVPVETLPLVGTPPSHPSLCSTLPRFVFLRQPIPNSSAPP